MVTLVSDEGVEFPVRRVLATGSVHSAQSCGAAGREASSLHVEGYQQHAGSRQCVSTGHSPCAAPRLTRTRTGAFLEAKSGKVRFEEIKAEALAMVVKFMEYKLKLVDRHARARKCGSLRAPLTQHAEQQPR